MFIKALEERFIRRAERYAKVRELSLLAWDRRFEKIIESAHHDARIMRRTPAMRKEASWREEYKGDMSLTRQERVVKWTEKEEIE